MRRIRIHSSEIGKMIAKPIAISYEEKMKNIEHLLEESEDKADDSVEFDSRGIIYLDVLELYPTIGQRVQFNFGEGAPVLAHIHYDLDDEPYISGDYLEYVDNCIDYELV